MSHFSLSRLSELAKLFLKIGVIGFGGPAAHIAMMEDEVVKRRQWLTRSQFLDLVGATNLIPGPNSTEMAIHIGYIYGGLLGLIVAGVGFIFPAVIITAIFAYIYTEFGSLPQIAPLFYGIKPVVIAVILGALWRLGQKAMKSRQLLIIVCLVVLLLLLGINEVIALLLGGLFGIIGLKIGGDQSPPRQTTSMLVGGLSIGAIINASVSSNLSTITPSLWQLGLFFLKVGSVLFGSGYVLVAFLEGELVANNHWLTQQQLIDAIAIGQFTPGPVLSTATFIGYLILGIPGAITATIGIFLPSFFFVAALNPLIPKLRQSKLAGAFLDAVNVSSVALMAVVTLRLAQTTFLKPIGNLPFDLIAIVMTIIASVLVLRFGVNTPLLVLGGALIGWLSSL